tara:strand:+ start:134 stop:520 length:387 start_codon:yes stop_codon:yes gene_type:complete
MGFLGAAGLAARSIKKIKSRLQDTSKPGHTHGGDSSGGKQEIQNQTYEPLSDGSGQQSPTFMGKNEVDSFSSLTDPSSVDRSGRTILTGGRPETGDPILNVPTPPAPELGQVPVPIPGVDETGVQSLY